MPYTPNNRCGPVMMPPGGMLKVRLDGREYTGFTPDELVEKVIAYRSANNLRIGDARLEVNQAMRGVQHYCQPMMVNEVERPKPSPRYIDKINSWLANRLTMFNTITYVDDAEAKRRAAICARCPKNKEWRNCPTCNKSTIRNMESNVTILSQDKRTPLHDRLKGCTIANHENRLAVWLPEEFLKHRVNYMDELPSFCWLKKMG